MLGRDVAIKVLPDEFAQDTERLRRFQREAKLLAALNHPNIASIYGLEQSDSANYLVLELVPGETLAARIARGPIPVDEAREIASKIADALEAAHEQGIVHRDLKPANIMLTPDDKVIVLDFGLAKVFVDETPNADSSMSPTRLRQGFGEASPDGTRVGVILGTAAYMSPEQAKGKHVDKRTDIFAFGAVLFEMLTGKRAFAGEDVSETLAYVLTKEPDWRALPAETPATLRQALRVCLTKDSNRRAHCIADVRLAIDGEFETTTEVSSPPTGWRPSWAVAAALALAAVTGTAIWNLKPEAPRPVARVSITLPDVLPAWVNQVMAISPDGTRVVYSANNQLYVRAMDQIETTALRGTEGGRTPFFSPDGEWVAFWSQGTLKKIPIGGGAPVSLCDGQGRWGARWGADDTIVFGQRGVGILRVSADGGTPEVLVPVEAAGEVIYGPQVLPGGNAVLFALGDTNSTWDEAQIVVHSLDNGETKVLVEGGRDARYLPSGHLVYVRDQTLFAAPFDVDRLEVRGGSVAVVEGVMGYRSNSGAAQFSVSDTGSLVYVSAGRLVNRALVWVDRDGREEALTAEPRMYAFPRISPDGSQVAIDVRDRELDIWIWHFSRETLTRLTFGPGVENHPTWTPDGRQVAFSPEQYGIYRKSADGTGSVKQLTEEMRTGPYAFSPDGDRLVISLRDPGGSWGIGVLSQDGTVETLLSTEYNERNAELSPDGDFLAYESDESGRYEIYIRPFPNVEDGRWPVSSSGGTQALWSRDGQELFYLAPGGELMATRVRTEPSFTSGKAEVVFAEGIYYTNPLMRTYDISPDGERFLMIKEVKPDGASWTELLLVQNWFEELERLVPTEN
ncbi:MAG: serine/threonine-protein kinase [Acidobacteria bacterium]|nr:MAG: serine/threonine-protein kinase [Acidobacteriota bacterium]